MASKKLTQNDNDKLNELSEEFIQRLVSAGALKDEKISDETRQKREQEKAKICYRCTKILLGKYRKILKVINSLALKEFQVLPELKTQTAIIDKVLDYVDGEYLFRDKLIEEKLNSLRFSRNLIERVNIALTVMSKGSKENAMYKALYYRYIDPEELPEEEVLKKLGISRAVYYRRIKSGLEELSTLLWITDDVEVSLVLEAIARLDL